MGPDSVLHIPVLFYFYIMFVAILTIAELGAVCSIIRIAIIINRLRKDISE